MPSGGMSAMLQKIMAMFGNSGSAGPASNGFAMPGAGGTPSLGALSSSLPSFINPSQITGVSTNTAPGPSSASPSPLSALTPSSGSTPASQKPGESAINTGLQIGSMIPGPQQPFVAAASAIAPTVEGLFGGGGGGPAPAPTPYQPKPVAPMNLPSLTAAPPSSALTPLSSVGGSSLSLPGGGGGNQSLSQLIQSLMAMKGAG